MRPSVTYAILCDGNFPENPVVRDMLLSSDVVVCCDGAAKSFMKYRIPEFVVGDMDSLSPELRSLLSDRLHPEDGQETNDLSKAFRWVCAMLQLHSGHSHPDFFITIYGATGKREDHSIGNISLLADYDQYLRSFGLAGRISMMTDYGLFFPLGDSSELSLPKDQTISIFAFDSGMEIKSTGLEYSTDGVKFDMWWKATLNRVLDRQVTLLFSRPAKVLLYLPSFFGNKVEVRGINVPRI